MAYNDGRSWIIRVRGVSMHGKKILGRWYPNYFYETKFWKLVQRI